MLRRTINALALLAIMAERLHLDGVAFRPSWYPMAYAARHGGSFVEAKRQGRNRVVAFAPED